MKTLITSTLALVAVIAFAPKADAAMRPEVVVDKQAKTRTVCFDLECSLAKVTRTQEFVIELPENITIKCEDGVCTIKIVETALVAYPNK